MWVNRENGKNFLDAVRYVTKSDKNLLYMGITDHSFAWAFLIFSSLIPFYLLIAFSNFRLAYRLFSWIKITKKWTLLDPKLIQFLTLINKQTLREMHSEYWIKQTKLLKPFLVILYFKKIDCSLLILFHSFSLRIIFRKTDLYTSS